MPHANSRHAEEDPRSFSLVKPAPYLHDATRWWRNVRRDQKSITRTGTSMSFERSTMESLESRRLLSGFGCTASPSFSAVGVTVADSTVHEEADEGQVVNVTFTRNDSGSAFNPDDDYTPSDMALTVPVVIGGDATNGQDYTHNIPGTVTFAAFETEKVYQFTLLNDAVAEPDEAGSTGSELFEVHVSDGNGYVSTEHKATIAITDDTKFYYEAWSLRLGPDDLEGSFQRLGQEEHISSQSGGHGSPPTWEYKRVDHLYRQYIWVPKFGETSDEWMNDVDGDNKDDNDVSFNFGVSKTTNHSFSFGIGATSGPINYQVFSYTGGEGTTYDKSQSFGGGADDHHKIRVIALVQEVHYQVRWEQYRRPYVNGGTNNHDWTLDNTGSYTKARGVQESPEFRRAIFETQRHWLDADDPEVQSLFETEPPDEPEQAW